jgi:hypothetical protein
LLNLSFLKSPVAVSFKVYSLIFLGAFLIAARIADSAKVRIYLAPEGVVLTMALLIASESGLTDRLIRETAFLGIRVAIEIGSLNKLLRHPRR